MKIIFITLISLLAFSCGESVKKGPSKDEIQKRVKDGDEKDYCEEFNWYGDGTCDEFCLKKDSDCTRCLAQPGCEKGFNEVKACADQMKAKPGTGVAPIGQGYECKEVNSCGTTIYCEKDHVSCLAIAIEPTCPKGQELVKGMTCPPNRVCKEVTADDGCGGNISWLCAEELVQCGAIPTCKDNELWVEQCRLYDTHCKSITLCGTTIFCAEKQVCDSEPTCAKDEIPAKGGDCDNAECRQVYECSSVLKCAGAPNCKAPRCEGHQEKVEFDACKKGGCEEVVGCGESILCKDLPD